VTVPATPTSSQVAVLTGALPVLRELGRGTTLTQTAHLQGLSQPALSRMVMRWEAELSVPLLHRVGRGVALTQEGHALANAATDALSVFESSLEQVLDERDARPVRLGALRSLSGRIAPLLADTRSPVSLSVSEGSASSLLTQLEAADLDAVIVGAPAHREDLQLDVPRTSAVPPCRPRRPQVRRPVLDTVGGGRRREFRGDGRTLHDQAVRR
jgi:DNA-binding transcriptional LysR family regulator